jgi:hypothetical protein
MPEPLHPVRLFYNKYAGYTLYKHFQKKKAKYWKNPAKYDII